MIYSQVKRCSKFVGSYLNEMLRVRNRAEQCTKTHRLKNPKRYTKNVRNGGGANAPSFQHLDSIYEEVVSAIPA